MDEAKLIEKLRLIEALYSGAATEGERDAAERARDRILERLKQSEREDPPVEYRFSMVDMWSRKVFVALLRRYGIRPYRYRRQRYTTVMARVSSRFVDQTLWPEFQEIQSSLQAYLMDVTNRVVHQVIHQDSSEAEVVEAPGELPPARAEAGAADAGTSPPAAASGRSADASEASGEAAAAAAHNASTGRTAPGAAASPEQNATTGGRSDTEDTRPPGTSPVHNPAGTGSNRARKRQNKKNRRNKRKRR